jgi:phosphatidylglycerophosphate synthase
MTTSTPSEPETSQTGGRVADILTLIRALITPIIMIIIIKGWPLPGYALAASIIFIGAALTDIFDDYFGGAQTALHRKLGWFDDIADIILVIGTLIAMSWVIYHAGLMSWIIAVPIALFIGKEILIGLFKGFELSNLNPIEDSLATAKNALSMLAVSVLIASPWLTAWLDGLRAASDPYAVYNESSPIFWLVGTGLLWIAALIGLIHALRLFQTTQDIQGDNT